MRLPSTFLSETEFLTFTAVSELGTATVDDVRDYLVEHHDRDLVYKTVATLMNRVFVKGWLRNVEAPPPVGQGRPQLLFAATVPFDDALLHHFHRFLDTFGLDRPEALAVLKRAIRKM